MNFFKFLFCCSLLLPQISNARCEGEYKGFDIFGQIYTRSFSMGVRNDFQLTEVSLTYFFSDADTTNYAPILSLKKVDPSRLKYTLALPNTQTAFATFDAIVRMNVIVSIENFQAEFGDQHIYVKEMICDFQ